MGSETITGIIIALIGGLIVILFGTSSSLFNKNQSALNDKIEKQDELMSKRMDRQDQIMEKYDALLDKQSTAVTSLVLSVDKLASAVSGIKEQFSIRHDANERTLKEHHQEIEMLRSRTHDAKTDIEWIVVEARNKKLWDVEGRPKGTTPVFTRRDS